MTRTCQNLSSLLVGILLMGTFATRTTFGESRNTNALAPADQRIQDWLGQKPKAEESFYDQLFSNSDSDIRNRYTAISGAPGSAQSISPLFIGNTSLVANPALVEAHSREDFAFYVVRLRLNSGVRNSVRLLSANPNNAVAIQKLQTAQRAIDNIRQQSVVVGSGPEPLVFKFGYDLVTDVTQVWWEKGAMRAGIVHSGLLSVGAASFGNALVHFSTSLGRMAPRAFIGMPVRANAVDLGLAHTLAPGTEAQLRFGSIPASGDIPHHERLHATIALPF